MLVGKRGTSDRQVDDKGMASAALAAHPYYTVLADPALEFPTLVAPLRHYNVCGSSFLPRRGPLFVISRQPMGSCSQRVAIMRFFQTQTV